nr:discoidin domain-containing protein [Paenibacillus bovis]
MKTITQPLFLTIIISVLLLSSISVGISRTPSEAADVPQTGYDLQQGKESSASSIQNIEHDAKYAIDGDPSTRWAADGSSKPQWLQVDLGDTYEINSLLTVFEFNDSYYRYKVEVSVDGENWDIFVDRSENTELAASNGYYDIGSAIAQYIRITVTDTQHAPMWVSIREFRINPQLHAIATASTEQNKDVNQAAKAIDGNMETRWAADGDSKPQWLIVDYGESKNISTIKTVFEFDDSYYQYKIEVSKDKENWELFADRTENTELPGNEGYIDEGNKQGRYVRITVTNTQHPGMWVSIKEFQLNPAKQEATLKEKRENIAIGKNVTASSTMSDEFSPAKAVDGLVGTTHWSAANNDQPHWLMVDLGDIYYVTGTKTFFEFNDAAYQYLIETSENGEDWSVFSDQRENAQVASLGYMDNGGVSARYVRITVHGEMWSSIWDFEVYGTKNLAQGKKVLASSEQNAERSGQMAVDGNRKSTRWASDGASKPQWLEVDLGVSKEIARTETYFEHIDSYYQYMIEVSEDKENWQVFADRTQNTVVGNPSYTDVGNSKGRYIRITVTGTETDPMWPSIWEFRVFGVDQVERKTDKSVTSGAYELVAEVDESGRYGIGVYKNGKRVYYNNKPQQLFIKDDQDSRIAYEAAYNDVQLSDGTLVFTGKVGTNRGSIISFKDIFSIGNSDGVFEVKREVNIEKATEGDVGFNSKFSLMPEATENMEQYEMLAPGNWYKDNSNVVKGAFASDYSHEYFYIREMRLPLPFFMMRNEVTGDTISISHKNANPKSTVNERNGDWLVDSSFSYGSLGIHKLAQPSLDFVYPAMEGEINYIDRNKPWVLRSHPVNADASQQYELVLRFDRTTDYEEALQQEWRTYFEIFNPQVKNIDVQALYNNAIDLLDTYARDYNGVFGLPFKADVPDGEITGNAMVMGFVGQQLPAAYQMIRYGLEQNNPNLVEKGTQMVEFWVQNSMTPSGLPKTWYEPYFEGTGVFTNHDVDIRTMSDGMEGAADAFQIMKQHGNIKQEWLEYIQTFGDWLVNNQNEDGSYYRIYDLEGNPVHKGIFNTTNPIRFLLKLYEITNDVKYKNAALKAGEFAYEAIYKPFMFVGGTSDNDNTIDKEASVMAMNAFLALYDETKEDRWLEALKGAADFTATWTFAWSYDTPPAGTRWAANGDTKPQWLQVDLGETVDISRVETYMEFPNMAYQYKVEVSTDGENWTVFADRTNNTEPGNPKYVDEKSSSARYVRISVIGTENPGAWVSIWEFLVLDDAGNNLALGKKTTASSSTQSPKYATDGNIDTNLSSPFNESGLIGQSLVATGHSYVDTYMAYLGEAYYRLYLFTDDETYLRFSKLLQNNANYTADWKGAWGYAHPGLVEEGGNVTELAYSGIGTWLVWNTVAQIQPLSDLEDRFGSMSIEEIEKLPLQERKRLNTQKLNSSSDDDNNPDEDNHQEENNNQEEDNDPGEDNKPDGNNNQDEDDNVGGNGNADKEDTSSESSSGDLLPNTTTTNYNWLLLGTIMLLVGTITLVFKRKNKQSH